MPLTKAKKIEILGDLKEKLVNSKAVIFTDYSGVAVVDLHDLRKKLRVSRATFKVTKNTLLKKALSENSLEIDEKIFTKPLAVSFDEHDEVVSSKIISEKAKETEKLEILGGIINGEFVGTEKITELAKMPSREELYAKVVGTIAAPISRFVNVLAGNLRGLVNVLNQYKESKNN